MLSPAVQLARNQQLDSFFVRNLNQDPTRWALEDKSVDAALCCVSVQYLQQVTMLRHMVCTSRRVCCSFVVCSRQPSWAQYHSCWGRADPCAHAAVLLRVWECQAVL